MSTSNVGLTMPSLRSTLPILSASLFSLALLGGAYNFSNPVEAAKAFGINLPASGAADSKSASAITPTERAYAQVHGIRNVATGLSGMSMLAFLRFSSICQNSTIAAEAVRKVIGITLALGCIVGFTDGWILKQFSQADGLSNDTVEMASKQSQGHAIMALPVFGLGVAWLYS